MRIYFSGKQIVRDIRLQILQRILKDIANLKDIAETQRAKTIQQFKNNVTFKARELVSQRLCRSANPGRVDELDLV